MEDRIVKDAPRRADDRYGLVIGLVVLSYVIAASWESSGGRLVVILVQLVTVWLVFTVSEARRARRVAGGAVLIVLALIVLVVVGTMTVVVEASWATTLAEGPLLIVLVALYALTPVVIVTHVIRRPAVDRETLLGGVAAYLLIGMTYAFGYVALGEFQASSPLFGEQGDGTTAQCLFFSFTTLTTTGYGDLVPAGNPGQSLAISEAVLGQLFLVTALGKIVSSLSPRVRSGRAAGAAD